MAISLPNSDISNSQWLSSVGTDLYSCINESGTDDGEYIYVNTLNAECIVSLQSIALGGTGTYTVDYKAKGDGATDLIVSLLCGSTVAATWTETNVSNTVTLFSHDLTAQEIVKLTDGTALKLKFESA